MYIFHIDYYELKVNLDDIYCGPQYSMCGLEYEWHVNYQVINIKIENGKFKYTDFVVLY